MITSIRTNCIKGIIVAILTLSTLMVHSNDGIKRFVVDEAEMLCRIDNNVVDTISFSAIRDVYVASGVDFLSRLDRILSTLREKNMPLSNELRLYLGCKLPLEMQQTLYQVVSEHYADRFARKNYVISSSGREYAQKLIGRGFFRNLDTALSPHGYKVKSIFLEKVVIVRQKELAYAFTDITLSRFMTNGDESPAYVMLTNKLSQCIVDGCWRYETNGIVRIRKIFLPVKVDKQFSDEIIASLGRSCPKEWNDAVSSSGNTDNPKMFPLRQYFNDAVLHTPTIIRFLSFAKNKIDQNVVLRIHHEKLSYTAVDIDRPDKKKRMIRCFLWVEVRSPIESQNAVANVSEKSILLSTLKRILVEEKDNDAVDSCVILFHAEVFLSDVVLQKEQQNVLVHLHPEKMSAAIKSSGNIHNPKLDFLYTALKPAINESPSMKELSQVASMYGYDPNIRSLGGEKIHFRRKDSNGRKFANPDFRIYGIVGLSARKAYSMKKDVLSAMVVDVDETGNLISDEIKTINRSQYW